MKGPSLPSGRYNKNGRPDRQNRRTEAVVAAVVMAVFLVSDIAGAPMMSAALAAGAGAAGTVILLVTTKRLRPAPFAEGLLFAGVAAGAHLLSRLGIRGMALPLGQAAVSVLLLTGGGGMPGLPAMPAASTRFAASVMLAAAAVEAAIAAWLDPGPVPLWGALAVSTAAAAALARRAAERSAGFSSFNLDRTADGRFKVLAGGSEICRFEMHGTGSLASVTGLVVSSGSRGWLALEGVGEAASREGYSAILLDGDPVEETALLQAGFSRREGGWHRVIPVTSRRAVIDRGRPG